MQTTEVRATGVRLTTLGLGAAPAGNLYRATTDDEAYATFQAAWDAGIRYFDTAPHYGLGLSERRLGAYLRTRPRDELVISTKVGRLLVPSPETADRRDPEMFDVPATSRRVWDFSRDGVLASIEASLERTGLDRIDVAYLHDPDEHWTQAAHEALPALVELRDQGVVGAIGAGMNQSAMLARFVRETDVDVVMCAGRFTLLEQPALADLLPAAAERGVAVVAAAVYNSGLLAQDRPPSDATYDYAPVAAEP
ncbi:aldo/keto reductase, partial [Promicromonospora kroppenstedtii]|uniref:aldo/keto reductase n=1 Tax=Promicromonospora kroppenstedtii TaxID=440482 RepID=UPI0009FD5DE7